MKAGITGTVKQFGNVIALFRSEGSIAKFPRAQKLVAGMEELQATLLPVYTNLLKQDTFHDTQVSEAMELVRTRAYSLGKAVEDIILQKDEAVAAKNIHTSYVLLNRKGSASLLSYGKSIVQHAEAHVADLADYNKGEEHIEELKEALEALKAAADNRKRFVVEQQARSLQLEVMVKQARALLESCNVFMEAIRIEEPAAYRIYQEERKIPDSGNIQSNIRIIDESNNEPVLEAKVEIYSTTRNEKGMPLKVLERTTGVNGELRIAKLDYDIYEVVVTKISHEVVKTKMVVADSRQVRLDIFIKAIDLN